MVLGEEPKADVKHSGQLWLLFPAVRCSSTLLAFLGHSNKFFVFFRDTCLSRALTECITFLLMGSSDGAKMQRRAPFGKTTSCYTTCYTEHYKIRQLQTRTETLWLVLPCETNSLVRKITPSDHISQSVAHSQGSLSYDGLICKTCMFIWPVKEALQAAAGLTVYQIM